MVSIENYKINVGLNENISGELNDLWSQLVGPVTVPPANVSVMLVIFCLKQREYEQKVTVILL